MAAYAAIDTLEKYFADEGLEADWSAARGIRVATTVVLSVGQV